MATGDAYWSVGTLTVPGSTGAVTVTGMPEKPAAVFFWGTDWLTEDVAVTTNPSGMFRGMAAPKWDDPGTIVQGSASLRPNTDNHIAGGHAITMYTASGTHRYTAQLTSFNSDGFTVTFDGVSSGGYKIIYAALLGVDNIAAYSGTNATIDIGFKAGASLLHGGLGGPEGSLDVGTADYFAGGAYPTSGDINWMGAGLSAFSFPPSASAQYNIGIFDDPPHIVLTQGGVFVGPFLTVGDVLAYPTGTGLEDMDLVFTNSNGGMAVMWEDENTATGRVTPPDNENDVVTVSGLPFRPGLLIGYSISDEPQGQGTGGRGAVGFSVVGESFQWTALVDGVSSRGSFQSFNRGFASNVSGTSVHAGTISLTHDGFVMTAEEDDLAPQSWVWHAFGQPKQQVYWIPNLYRRQN